MSTLFCNLDVNDSKGFSLFSVDGNIRLGGSADVKLRDGIKSPDFSLYESHPEKLPLTQAWPTVVWEVAYTEDEKKLAHDLGRYVACSLGRVQLAIGVKIERNRVQGGFRGVKRVTCALWEADYAEGFVTLEASGSPKLDCLIRCDDHADKADDYVVPPATKFSCVSKLGDEYVKFVVSQQVLYTAGAFPLDYLSTL
jgi:hypothetical protein